MRLSIVAVSRNDDHGGEMTRRMRMFVSGLDFQARRHGLQAELVLVDWNPPPDRPSLAEILPRPAEGSPLTIRHIIVPSDIHRRWRHWESIPLFQMIAKNVGIRRARGEFVLATNVDLLFSDSLCDFLARQRLEPDVMYRANRCDVPAEVLQHTTGDEQLEFCRTHVIRRQGMIPNRPYSPWRIRQTLFHPFQALRQRAADKVDTDACGDFTLLARAAWNQVRGYPEIALYSIYIDGLGCHAAVACGMRQIVLPPDCCTYHAEHGSGWSSMSITEKIRTISDRPALDYGLYEQSVCWMHTRHAPLDLNDEFWGCSREVLEERQFPER